MVMTQIGIVKIKEIDRKGICENCGEKGEVDYIYSENFYLGRCKFCGGNVL